MKRTKRDEQQPPQQASSGPTDTVPEGGRPEAMQGADMPGEAGLPLQGRGRTPHSAREEGPAAEAPSVRGRPGRRSVEERRDAVLALLAGKASVDVLAKKYGVLLSVNYSFPSATTISPHRVDLLELVHVVVVVAGAVVVHLPGRAVRRLPV